MKETNTEAPVQSDAQQRSKEERCAAAQQPPSPPARIQKQSLTFHVDYDYEAARG